MTEVNDIGGKPPLGALFSTVASDNAEVVPPTAPRGPESMWSTEVPTDRPAGPDGAPVVDGELLDDTPPPFSDGSSFSAEPNRGADPWAEAPAADWTRPNASIRNDDGPFSAEPIPHDDDVIDSGDLFDPTFDESAAWNSPPPSVFSNGSASNGAAANGAAAAAPVDDSPWTIVGDDWERAAAAEPAPRHAEPFVRPRDDAPPSRPRSGSGPVGHSGVPGVDEVVADPHGLEAAIARLSPVEQERTVVPIAVCGALLEADETVAGVVTGQMLGRPAAVMVTDRRVVIANDRRWQPLVDVYRIDSKLIVRGRHDRHVAALSFADAERLSMIDGIFEVELAIELAERIRDTDPIT